MLIFHRADKNKSHKITVKSVIKSKIDIKSGKMTFGQRIELGIIFAGSDSEIVKFQRVFECLHGYSPKIKNYKKLIDYFTEIVNGLKYWSDAESKMLKYEPTPEEKLAGIQSLSKKIGSMGTVDALAEKYGVDPDIVINWDYAKVFGILYADLEKAKYQRSYQKVIEKKR